MKTEQKPTNDRPYGIGSAVWPGISKLIEESGELQQVLGKIIGAGGEVEHWDGSNLRARLQEELADTLAAASFVQEACALDNDFIEKRVVKKLELFRKWHVENAS